MAMREFAWGVLAMASLIAALFFLKYWRASRERLFAFFALAFAGMTANWTVLALVDQPVDEARQVHAYVIRLVAYVVLIIGIIDKNRRSGGRL
jgi:Family of unknown function (DUF5985)